MGHEKVHTWGEVAMGDMGNGGGEAVKRGRGERGEEEKVLEVVAITI